MSLYQQLQERERHQNPIRVGLIGAGKFGAMYLAQIPRTPGVRLVGIADLSPDAARTNLKRVGWDMNRIQAKSIEMAVQEKSCFITDDWTKLVNAPQIDTTTSLSKKLSALGYASKKTNLGKQFALRSTVELQESVRGLNDIYCTDNAAVSQSIEVMK